MPLKVGTTSVVRLYKQEYALSLNPGGDVPLEIVDPTGKVCTLDTYVTWNGNYYKCVRTEVLDMYEPNLDSVIHRRVTITFDANGGSGGSSQTRTWDVENVVQPNSPSRNGYIFNGWATTSNATTPNVSFPFVAPQSDITYYAVWSLPPTTATPTVGTPRCRLVSGMNTYVVSITNNESVSVVIKDGATTLGTMTAFQTNKEFTFDIGFPTPYYYNINITAQADGLEISDNVSRSGTITTCPIK